MSDNLEVAKSLHPLERKILPLLRCSHAHVFSDLLYKSGMKDVEVMRALQWLENKHALKLEECSKEVVVLGENGKRALNHGLPEKAFLSCVKQGKKNLEKLKAETGLSPQEINVCIGLLKGKAAIEVEKHDNDITICINDHGKHLCEKESLEEQLIKKIGEGEIDIKTLKPEEKHAYDSLLRRKDVIKTVLKKDWTATLTDLGKSLAKLDIKEGDVVERLTPELLKSGAWKGKEFRPYDLKAKVPRIQRGKRHFVNQAIQSSKRILTDMGFKEMTGQMVQTSFWNFDALFTAQDHPVREMQDTFFLKHPKCGKLPDKHLVDAVRKTHEDGWTTGSSGWMYKWNEEESKRNVLRTHTTCLSARTLARLKKENMPAKFFAVGKCFRNETLDWSHLFEFNQTEGIVVDENANFRHLLGYLRALFKKMGYDEARFRPAYFPYTEFSVEIDVFHPIHKKWFELGGAGIFRPEVVKPLMGIDVPVLAWGPGFDRIMIEFFKISDIRELYKNDLKQLREIKEWTRT